MQAGSSRRRIPLVMLAGLGLVFAGCRDVLSPAHSGEAEPPASSLESELHLATLRCEVSVTASDLSCREETAPGVSRSAEGPSYAIYGNNQVKLTSTNVHKDTTTGILYADVTIQNLRSGAIGTPDGTTVTGMKVFFHEGPTAIGYAAPGDTGSVTVNNPDGYGKYSKAGQPYHFYPEILQAGDTSAVKTWEFKVAPTVTTWSFTVYVFTRYPGEPDVPMLPPDTVPASVYDTTKIIYDDSIFGGPLVRNLVLITFESDATAEERLAAVNRTNGTVVGGRRLTPDDGIYVVRVPDDGTTGPLKLALDRLSLLPQVATATPEYLMTVDGSQASVTPSDYSVGWRSLDWELSPDAATGANWHMEAIDAPDAWGCTVGNASVRVAVVDDGFHPHSDMPSVTNSGWATATTSTHGLGVASMLGAQGNNGEGIAGVMWNADLRYFNINSGGSGGWRFVPESLLMVNVAQAVTDGARVINLSRGAGYYDASGNPRRPQHVKRDSARAQMYRRLLSRTIQVTVPFGNDPLFVLSAGNYHQDAFFNGLPGVVEDFPDRVITVGAIMEGSTPGEFEFGVWDPTYTEIKPGSNYGPLVEIAAPGVYVQRLWTGAGTITASGTSFAAPLVSGAAGLMLSLDPRLSATELKDLLIVGALEGGRSVVNGPYLTSSLPILNVRESLELVAERQGAGVCGNPIWHDGTGGVYVRRGLNWGGSDELVFTHSDTAMSVQHRDRRIRFASGAAWQFENGTWSQGTAMDPPDNATYRSIRGVSHDGDVTVTVTVEPGADPKREEWFVIYINGGELTRIKGPPINKQQPVSRCVQWETSGTEWDSCVREWGVYNDYRSTTHTVSYSSARREVVLAVARDSSAASIDEAFYYDSGYYNRNYYNGSATLDTYLYYIPVDDPTSVRTDTIDNYEVNNVGFSDDGQLVVMRRALGVFNNGFSPVGPGNFNAAKSCTVDYDLVGTDNDFSLPEVTGTMQCYKDAIFAP